jgi:hypothetical protein
MYLKNLLGVACCILLTNGIFAQAPTLPSASFPLSGRIQAEPVPSYPAYGGRLIPTYDPYRQWNLNVMAAQQRALDDAFRQRLMTYRIVDSETTGGIQSPRDYSHEENRRLRKFTNPAILGIQIDSTGEPYPFRPALIGFYP